MSGNTNPLSLYFHIPFCCRKCPYCHFYVIPNKQAHQDQLLEALLLEWKQILLKVKKHEIVSIYFGGGTPSLFEIPSLNEILAHVHRDASIASDCEITLEANPEDVTLEKMQAYKKMGINRISMGVQSLEEESLHMLERTHSAKKALEAIECTEKSGISNISIDLMYELPDQTLNSFERTLSKLKDLPISHLSLYNLTIEPHTSFSKRLLRLPPPEENLKMLESAVEQLERMGLKRYEISAFAKPSMESKHNSGYWTGRPFFGLGPSAFSYYEGVRFRNVANILRYHRALKEGASPVDFEEKLPYPNNMHELFAVRLRLIHGASLSDFDLPEQTHRTLSRLTDEGFLVRDKDLVRLSKKGLLFYDTVASEII